MGKGNCLLISNYLGYGDALYQTPLIGHLKKLYGSVDVWAYNTEPFYNNPDINKLFKIQSDPLINPSDFYLNNIYYANNATIKQLLNHHIHMTDAFTLSTLSLTLRPQDKNLILKWGSQDEAAVVEIFQRYNLLPAPTKECNFVVINPTINWPSRTLPLDFYKELIARIQDNGDKVVLVGKETSPNDVIPANYQQSNARALQKDEVKSLYAASEFGPDVIDLTNQLTFHQCGALYAMSKIAINTENGNMVLSCTNNVCWNVYIPTLTAPEFRLPYRKGSLKYRTVVAANSKDSYPTCDTTVLASSKSFKLTDAQVQLPTVDQVFKAYLKANGLYAVGANWHAEHPSED